MYIYAFCQVFIPLVACCITDHIAYKLQSLPDGESYQDVAIDCELSLASVNKVKRVSMYTMSLNKP